MQTLLRVVVDGVESSIADIYEPLPRAVIISLFSWRRAERGDLLPSTDRMGWWGDTYPPAENDRIGSRLWLLTREKITAETLARAKEYAEEALQWMLDDKVAESVTVEVERHGLDRVALGIRLVRGDLTELNIRFADLWNHLTHDRTLLPVLTLAPVSVSHIEGDSGSIAFEYTINRAPAIGISQISYAVVGIGANPANAADFVGGVLPSGTITFTNGQGSATITLLVSGDATYEQDETFELRLSNAVNAKILVPTVSGTITNDDPDPISANTVLLMHMDDTALSDAKGHTITLTGNVARSSAQSKFSGYSALLTPVGVSIDCGFAALSNISIWTLEGWFYALALGAGNRTLFSQYHPSEGPRTIFDIRNGKLSIFNGATGTVSGTTTINTGEWFHVAFVKNSTTCRGYFKGNLEVTHNVFASPYLTNLLIGHYAGFNADEWYGHVDEVRCVHNIEIYTGSSFTPPTNPFV